MKPFDGNEYRKRVMSRLLDDFSLADPHTGDPFLVCDVDADADVAAVTKRVSDVVAAWQKDRNHPKYKGVAAQLVARRDDYLFVLTDPAARADALARVHGARAQTDAEAVEQLDKLAAALLKRHKGIPRSRIPALAAIATSEGMSETSFTTWLAQHQLVDDVDPDGAAPWEATVRRQIRSSLDELARIDPNAAPRCKTLLTFLGVSPNASSRDLAAAHARLVEANRARARDRVMTLTEDLLAHVSTRLMAADGIATYTASLRADARDTLKPELRRLAVLTGSLPAAEMEALSARLVGLGWGFSAAEARDLVRAAAHEVHLAVEVGGEVDLVVCPNCHRPQSVGRRKTCSYCRAHLYTDCPACATTIPAASDVCPSCSAPLAAWRAAAAAAPAAQAALDAGQLAEASRIATDALGGIDATAAPAPLRAVAATAAELLTRADRTWAELHRDLDRGALWAASASATWLARNAVDYPDPTPVPTDVAAWPQLPRDAAAMLALINERQRVADAAAKQAAALPAEEAEAALASVLRSYPDCPEALAALAALPLPAPRSLELTLDVGVATVSWEPAMGASRTVRYRLDRHITWPAEHVDHTTVGTTSTTHLEDAAAPAGTQVVYTVTAVDGTRSSSPVNTGAPVFVDRDVEVLHTEVVDGDVVLSWPTTGLGAAEVIVEREVDPSSGLTVPTRRMRPWEVGHLVDDDVSFDVPYTYRISLTYRTPDGGLVRTPGRTAAVTLRRPPKPVTELWASTDEAGRTTVAFSSPPSGLVRLYASLDGSDPLPGFTTGSVSELETAAASGHRLVGEGRRRVVDGTGRGSLVYRAVTVVDQTAIAGAALRHMAVAKPSELTVVSDDGRQVRVTFELPGGVTEAFVCWRRDRYPTSADEPAPAAEGAGAAKVTNTKLSIDGGYVIDAPADGRGLYVAVYPAVRMSSAAAATAAPVAASLLARAATPVEVGYRMRVSGLLRKKLDVTVETSTPGMTLPPLRLVARATEPEHPRMGTVLAEHPGGDRSVVLRVEDESWPTGDFTARLFALPATGADVRLVDPPESERRVTR